MVRVKICGITRAEDALHAREAGADFIGSIVDIPSSPRSITPMMAGRIFSALPKDVLKVAVMAPASIEKALIDLEAIRPDLLQLHGSEDTAFIKKLHKDFPCKTIKAIPVTGEATIPIVKEYSKVCWAVLLETPNRSLGGSGKTHDWSISRRIAEEADCPVFLAGGLNPDNVADAIKIVGPYCVDTSSGVESGPGVKDPFLVKRFIENAKIAS